MRVDCAQKGIENPRFKASGLQIRWGIFDKLEGSISVFPFISVGASISVSFRGGYWSKDYTIAIGNSVSIDPMPVKANITVTHGASNAGNFNGLNDELREAFNIRR